MAAALTIAAQAAAAPIDLSLSPNQRAWRRFKRSRIGVWSLWLFLALLVLSAFAEVLSNDKPLLARYNGEFYFPLFNNPPEVTI